MKPLTQPSVEALIALAAIGRHPRADDIRKWLHQEITSLTQRLITSVDQLETARLQGRVQALQSFSETWASADVVLSKQGTKVPL